MGWLGFALLATSLLQAPQKSSPAPSADAVTRMLVVTYSDGRTSEQLLRPNGLFWTPFFPRKADAPRHDGLEDGTYSGVVTGNTWGSPGAPFTTFGTYLLMPHPTVVNRLYGAVSDISNMGFGLTAGSIGFGYDIIQQAAKELHMLTKTQDAADQVKAKIAELSSLADAALKGIQNAEQNG